MTKPSLLSNIIGIYFLFNYLWRLLFSITLFYCTSFLPKPAEFIEVSIPTFKNAHTGKNYWLVSCKLEIAQDTSALLILPVQQTNFVKNSYFKKLLFCIHLLAQTHIYIYKNLCFRGQVPYELMSYWQLNVFFLSFSSCSNEFFIFFFLIRCMTYLAVKIKDSG